MAGDVIRLSQAEAENSKAKMRTKGESFLQGLRTLDAEVTSIQRWYQGQAATRFIDKYFSQVKPEIERMVNQCVEEYGALLMEIVSKQQEADASLASRI